MVELKIKIPLPEDPAKRALVIAIVGSILLHLGLLAWLVTMNPRGTPAYVKRGEPLLVDMAPDKPEEKAPLGNPSRPAGAPAEPTSEGARAARACAEDGRRAARAQGAARPESSGAAQGPTASTSGSAAPTSSRAAEAGGQGRAALAGAKSAPRAAGALSGCAVEASRGRRP